MVKKEEDRYVVQLKNIKNNKLLELLSNKFEKLDETHLSIDGKYIATHPIAINNKSNNEIGYFIFFHNLTNEYTSYQYTIQVMIFLLIGSFAVVFIVVNMGFNILIFKIDQSVKENEILVKELFHRVKNNFQIFIAYLSSEQIKEKESSVKNKLNTVIAKLKSMSIIHDMLYGDERAKKLNTHNYFSMFFLHMGLEDIECSLDIQSIELDNKLVKKIALLVNELVTNTIKHIDQKDIAIYFSLKALNHNTIKIEYKDNLSDKQPCTSSQKKGYGTVFIDELTSCLKNCKVKKGTNDFHYIITFEY
jgi:two-component sensor histidine kinase